MKRFYKLFSSAIVLVLTIGAGLSALVPVTNAAQVPAKLSDYQNHPHRDAIDYVVKNKLMWLFPDGSFQPDKPITQADLVAGLVNVKGLTVGEPVQGLPANHWAKIYYERAEKDGILNEVTVNPSKALTREEAGLLINNAWKNLRHVYKDKPQSYASIAVSSGWLPAKAGKFPNGVSTTLYDAFGEVTRSEEAVALYSLHRDFVGIIEGEKIATQFHNSLKLSSGRLRGNVPAVEGLNIRLLIRFKDGKAKSIYSGDTLNVVASQVHHLEFTVKRKNEATLLAIYKYADLSNLTRINAR